MQRSFTNILRRRNMGEKNLSITHPTSVTTANSLEEETQGGQLEEHLLYGYLGIAEDLDRLDFNTKKWILVKSKKEIQELANAPVKTDDKSLNK
ncbi:RNA RECOGNITION MOTIF XS DOMAIN PROTEIN-RELATED [Salix koriyanagi]|uniref:RNA RECOGNITION MOTIF XS DOMAIN PROTEIN-RELATED n=1 Tax=Salix koriyanagi TaxID=2511006 RepID=A0A9Q0WTW9_9ROSI|nr:RNA RECOGNITION MOTIF XS DOMAIN PROTEIN-RELATED [Salix koriyanagi]